jgi:hypothetical protein
MGAVNSCPQAGHLTLVPMSFIVDAHAEREAAKKSAETRMAKFFMIYSF